MGAKGHREVEADRKHRLKPVPQRKTPRRLPGRRFLQGVAYENSTWFVKGEMQVKKNRAGEAVARYGGGDEKIAEASFGAEKAASSRRTPKKAKKGHDISCPYEERAGWKPAVRNAWN